MTLQEKCSIIQKPPCQDTIYLKIKAKSDVLYF